MSSPQDTVNEVHRDQLRKIRRRRALAAVMAVLGLGGYLAVSRQTDQELICAEEARAETYQLLVDATIDETQLTTNEVRNLYAGLYQECME